MLGSRIPRALGASRLCPGALDRGFRPWSKRTFYTSRRALAIGVVGTPRTGRSAHAGLRGCCIILAETSCWLAGFLGPWARFGGAKCTRSSLHPHVLFNFLTISSSSSDWWGRNVGVPNRQQNPPSGAPLRCVEVEPSCSDREKRKKIEETRTRSETGQTHEHKTSPMDVYGSATVEASRSQASGIPWEWALFTGAVAGIWRTPGQNRG